MSFPPNAADINWVLRWGPRMPSVLIAAHNEETVLGTCLDALRAQDTTDTVEIIVSANGCTDSTAEVARAHGAEVVERTEPGKAAALNAGEAVATRYPRLYLDADIVLPPVAVRLIGERLAAAPPVLAVVPRRRVELSGRSLLVRAYFAINERLPAFQRGLFGRGAIGLSEAGRKKFTHFPELIADDLFLDSQFTDDEKAIVDAVEVVIQAPYTTKALMERLVRVRRGNAQMRSASAAGELGVQVRRSDRWAWLREVVLPQPRLLIAAVPYLVITLAAGILARRDLASNQWGSDRTTRLGVDGHQL